MTTFDVPLVPQQTAKSCWAASVTMLLSWAQQSSIDPAALTDIPGFQEAYEVKGLGLKTARIALATWGLVAEPPQDYSAQGFAYLLDSYGPLFVAAHVIIGDRIVNHSRVITGFDQDNDTVYINDPWGADMPSFVATNPGSQYTLTYEALLEQMDSLARMMYAKAERDDPTNQLGDLAFVAHLPARPPNL